VVSFRGADQNDTAILLESKTMRRSQGFVPSCSQVERRLLLSQGSVLASPKLGTTEVLLARSTTLNLSGVSPWGFAHKGKTISAGDPIYGLGLGGSTQNLHANGVKIPNSPYNGVVPAQGDTVAQVGINSRHLIQPAFYAPALLNLTTRKGDLTLDLTPVSPGSNKVDFSVASGTGVFAEAHGTGTITFGNLAEFRSNR
jgi:hypothetical protein